MTSTSLLRQVSTHADDGSGNHRASLADPPEPTISSKAVSATSDTSCMAILITTDYSQTRGRTVT